MGCTGKAIVLYYKLQLEKSSPP
jgi:hypothetical protein